MKSPQKQIAEYFTQKKLTLSVAESCTGGMLAHTLTNIPGSSAWFQGGIIAYANDVKIKMLNIPSSTIQKYGAVSKQTAILMAKNIRIKMKTVYGVGITGIAGPGGGTKEKPVGLVYIAIAHSKQTLVYQCLFHGTRLSIKKQTVQKAIEIFLTTIAQLR